MKNLQPKGLGVYELPMIEEEGCMFVEYSRWSSYDNIIRFINYTWNFLS